MKTFILLLCTVFSLAGCTTTVKAFSPQQRGVVVKKNPGHRKSKKVVVVVGTRVKERPHKSVVVYFKNRPYYYAGGVFYRLVDQVYEVVRPQIGMIVPELPEHGVEKMKMKGEVLYEYDGVLYKEVPTTRGIQFEVKGFINK